MTKMYINRTVVEQALEALYQAREFTELYDTEHAAAVNAQCHENITALRAALEQQDEPETCTWWQDGDSDSGTYSTSCGHYFSITDGTPEDNKMSHCCYCGKKLAQELITEDDDE